MVPVPEDIRLLRGAFWLTKLRWIAIFYVIVGTYVSNNILSIRLHRNALYAIAGLLSIYNAAVLLFLSKFKKADKQISCKSVKRVINLQICVDLFLLTVLLHFSGGIENPLVFYFIFHMIIASILLSPHESYLHATFAVTLFGLLVLLEYKGLIPHYCLTGFVPYCLQTDRLYVFGTFFIFATALYLAVYMANYIAIRLKHAEHAYREANVQLQEKDRIKDEYVSRVTHDIKGHLATIQCCLAVVVQSLTGKPDDQNTDLIKRAYRRTVELTNFVKALLRLTLLRLSNKLERDVFPLRDALKNSYNAVKSKAEDKFITLACNIDSSIGDVFGDRFSIEEMLTNLLLNAIKYTDKGGSVKLNAEIKNNCILIEIKDTGIGIPLEEQSKIFNEFYRATNAKIIEQDGTGLGLSIARHIIERHGGKIQVESEKDAGTTFRITLPEYSSRTTEALEQTDNLCSGKKIEA